LAVPGREAASEGVRLADWVRDLLQAYKEGLDRLYGERLKGLYLFGSHARGEAQPDSDVDLVVVLDEVSEYGREIRRTSELTASLALEYEVSISCVFSSRADWLRAEGPFLVNVRTDAIRQGEGAGSSISSLASQRFQSAPADGLISRTARRTTRRQPGRITPLPTAARADAR
jgi:predicted nucleotidyltransferase